MIGSESTTVFRLLSLMFVFGVCYGFGQTSLEVRKGAVIDDELRASVIEAGRLRLSETNDAFLALSEGADTPYAFEQPAVEEVVEVVQEKEIIAFDDASVLSVVVRDFAKQVRGTLAMGDTRFLQLKGGQMVKPGTTFPATIPQVDDRVFEVTISAVSNKSYTLQLGEASQEVNLSGSASGSAVRND